MPFVSALTDVEIAQQIADLINQHNNLARPRSAQDLLNANTLYIVEIHGKQVIGACGVQRQGPTISEIKNLVVRPQWRGRRLGSYLVKRAEAKAESPALYATIRADNEHSLRLFKSLGFQGPGTYNNSNHEVHVLVKVVAEWKPRKVSLYA